MHQQVKYKRRLRATSSAPLTRWPSTFYAVLSPLYTEMLGAPSSSVYSPTSISPFTESCCTFLCIDNCMNKCNSSATWRAPFSAISGAPFYLDLEVHYVKFQLLYQVHPKLNDQVHIKRIYRFSLCTLLCITRCTKDFTFTFIF